LRLLQIGMGFEQAHSIAGNSRLLGGAAPLPQNLFRRRNTLLYRGVLAGFDIGEFLFRKGLSAFRTKLVILSFCLLAEL